MNPLIAEVSVQDLCDWFTVDKKPPNIRVLPEKATARNGGLWSTARPLPSTEEPRQLAGRRRQQQQEFTLLGEQGCNEDYVQDFYQHQAHEYIKQQQQQSEQEVYEQSECGSESVTELAESVATLDSIYDLELESLEASSAFTESQAGRVVGCDVYRFYNFQHTYDVELPIAKHREKLLQMIESNQVLVVQGSTGSGKTTQIPQYVLDQHAQLGAHCNIVVTQPRKLAARSVAAWVSRSRNWELGGIVGYQVGLDKMANDDTRLVYMTTGILLRKFIAEKSMMEFTHVFIDEVHERDQETDFLLLLVRKLLRTNSRTVKVILMSATIDCQEFASYFSMPLMDRIQPAPMIFVRDKVHEVQVHYLEDMPISLGEAVIFDLCIPSIARESYAITEKLIRSFYDMEAYKHLQTGVQELGSVLVFLPGYGEITEMMEWLSVNMTSLKLLPLHSSLTPQEQKMVFDPVPCGLRKVILSTNIAESSITVPDIKYVIDYCLAREMVCETGTNYQSLRLMWASKANCDQRKGRVGRTSSGHCYRIVTKDFWNDSIPEYSIPEMLRCPLESTVLRVKQLDLGEPKAMLALALTPPNLSNIKRTVLLLKEVGALTITMADGRLNPHDGELTTLGRVLASLPIDLRLGKLLVLGHVFGCFHECLIIAASLSLQSTFLTPFNEMLKSFRHKLSWSDGSHSDCLAAVNAYKASRDRVIVLFPNVLVMKVEKKWGLEKMIIVRRMHEVDELMEEIQKRLFKFNIRLDKLDGMEPPDKYDPFVLKVVLAGAFYPFYFGCYSINEVSAAKEMNLHDPKTTVKLWNMPPRGQCYTQQLSAALGDCGRGKAIYFDGTRVFMEFQRDPEEHTASVLRAVYLALKMSQLRIPIRLKLLHMEDKDMDLQEATRMNPVTGLNTNRFCCDIQSQKLMEKTQTLAGFWLMVFITEVLDVGHFFAQKVDDNSKEVQHLAQRIGERPKRPLMAPPSPGDLCLSPYPDEKSQELYRARVMRVPNSHTVEVFFVDFGNTRNIPLQDLKELPQDLKDMPFQAMECMLCEVRPSALSRIAAGGSWSADARSWFSKQTLEKNFFMQVFSMEHGVLRVRLSGSRPLEGAAAAASGTAVPSQPADVGRMMVELGFAEPAEEAFESKQNHELLEGKFPVNVGNARAYPEVAVRPMVDGVDNVSMRSVSASSLHRVLHGPISSYEMRFCSMTNMGRLRSVRVGNMSVNSVAVNDEPQDSHDRLLVAASVNVNQSGSTILLRDTTLMPSIHGLPAILCLIFTPVMELRRDYSRSRYTGALCGLGWDPQTGEAIFTDHDMEVTFDTSFDMDDIIMINSLRMAINVMMAEDEETAQWSQVAVRRLQQRTRSRLLDLFFNKHSRKPMEPFLYNSPYCWNQIPPDELLPYSDEDEIGNCQLYQLHKSVLLNVRCPSDDGEPR
ncbi:unnamed protein product [Lampetra fluviatilis]